MQIRMLQPGEEMQLARMKWLHCQEDDRDYGEHNLDGADYATFAAEFTAFLRAHPEYRVYVAAQGDTLAAAMLVYVIPKAPKPGGHAQSIAYLTNVYTLPEWRNQGVGTRLLQAIEQVLAAQRCELLFAWPSERSVPWYARNGFRAENEIMECPLSPE